MSANLRKRLEACQEFSANTARFAGEQGQYATALVHQSQAKAYEFVLSILDEPKATPPKAAKRVKR